MAPSFFSKFAKTEPTHARNISADSTSKQSQQAKATFPGFSSPSQKKLDTRSDTPDTLASRPSVTIVPPSPNSSLPNSIRPESAADNIPIPPSRTVDGLPESSSSEQADQTMSPLLRSKLSNPGIAGKKEGPSLNSSPSPGPSSLPSARIPSLKGSASAGDLRHLAASQNGRGSPPIPPVPLIVLTDQDFVNKTSTNFPTQSLVGNHSRATKSPHANGNGQASVDEHGTIMKDPVVESPTRIDFNLPMPPLLGTSNTNSQSGPLANRSNSSGSPSYSPVLEPTNKSAKKKTGRPWTRGSANSRKPTGLATAIATSGFAMAHPTMAVPQVTPATTDVRNVPQRKATNAPASPPGRKRSASGKDKARSPTSAHHRPRRGSSSVVSVSAYSEGAGSEVYTAELAEYSALDEYSDDEDDSEGSDDGLDDLDLGVDMPVTGFAVASNKRNADFHELFPAIPEGDYLIEDYGCALQREILTQGRIYISENHVCFHANIFGWITDLSIPMYEITSLEKKMTAFVIPNAIQITTRQSKYNFASFLSRDTTYDVIHNIWRLARPEDASSAIPASAQNSFIGSGSALGLNGNGSPTPANGTADGDGGADGKPNGVSPDKVTQCACGKNGEHFSEKMMEAVFPGTPDKIHNLLFTSAWMKDFMRVEQKLFDIQISDWTPISPGSNLLSRNMSYIKPLTGTLGPKQTKCEIRDEMLHCDFNDYCVTLTTTRTPDVPSGGVFAVKSKTCIMWASAHSSKVISTTQVEWTGRSFIKGIIERSVADGQRTYSVELEAAMRKYIAEHKSEFVPEGTDLDEVAAVDLVPSASSGSDPSTENSLHQPAKQDDKTREHERNQRGLQWAYDTFAGAAGVGKQSAAGAIELIRDAWDQSTSTTILYFVIVGLVLSNLWTLVMVGKREEVGRRKEVKRVEERERWVQGIVTALREEMIAGVTGGGGLGTIGAGIVAVGSERQVQGVVGDLKSEVAGLLRTLDAVQERVKVIRDSVGTLNKLD